MKARILIWLLAAATVFGASPEAQRWARSVKIYRDRYGVPHIDGRTDASVVFGLMYAQAEDNFEQLEQDYIRALGRSAEARGPAGIANDVSVRLWEVEKNAKAEYARMDAAARGRRGGVRRSDAGRPAAVVPVFAGRDFGLPRRRGGAGRRLEHVGGWPGKEREREGAVDDRPARGILRRRAALRGAPEEPSGAGGVGVRDPMLALSADRLQPRPRVEPHEQLRRHRGRVPGDVRRSGAAARVPLRQRIPHGDGVGGRDQGEDAGGHGDAEGDAAQDASRSGGGNAEREVPGRARGDGGEAGPDGAAHRDGAGAQPGGVRGGAGAADADGLEHAVRGPRGEHFLPARERRAEALDEVRLAASGGRRQSGDRMAGLPRNERAAAVEESAVRLFAELQLDPAAGGRRGRSGRGGISGLHDSGEGQPAVGDVAADFVGQEAVHVRGVGAGGRVEGLGPGEQDRFRRHDFVYEVEDAVRVRREQDGGARDSRAAFAGGLRDVARAVGRCEPAAAGAHEWD